MNLTKKHLLSNVLGLHFKKIDSFKRGLQSFFVPSLPLLIFLSSSHVGCATEPPESRVVVERVGEGFHNIFIQQGAEKTLVWKSFWGNPESEFSPDKHYLAILDRNRLGVLSPLMVFKLDSESVRLVYQTPADFIRPETHFTYELVKLTNQFVEVRVDKLEYSGHSSRPNSIAGFSYKINSADLKPVTPTYYLATDAHYFNVNDAITSDRMKRNIEKSVGY